MPVGLAPNDCLTESFESPSTVETLMGVAPSVATVEMFGQAIALVSRMGSATIQEDCFLVDGYDSCSNRGLADLNIALQDIVIGGVGVQDATISLRSPVSIVNDQIAPGTMGFDLLGQVLGINVSFGMTNAQPVTVTSTATTLAIASHLDLSAVDIFNNVTTATMDIGVSASPALPASCDAQTETTRLLGFEDLALWHSSQATLALSARNPTQGCQAIDVNGTNYRLLNSSLFATPLPGTTSNLALDVFVPPNQPNPFYFGAVQMFASCPSAGLFNQYIAQVELTGKPVGIFSTLIFPLPGPVVAALQGSHSDCSFAVGVNTNPTPTSPTLDNLRFVP